MTATPALDKPRPRFDQEFIERRMRQHKAWQDAENDRLEAELYLALVCNFERKLARVKFLLAQRASAGPTACESR